MTNSVIGQKSERRLRIYLIDKYDFLSVINGYNTEDDYVMLPVFKELPEGYVIRSVHYDFYRDMWAMTVFHKSFYIVRDGYEPLTQKYRKEDLLVRFVKRVINHDTVVPEGENMNTKEYVEAAVRTDIPNYLTVMYQMDSFKMRLLHAAIGASTEAGELLDIFKKNIFYGKPTARTHILEEVGDQLWYLAIICDALNIDMSEIMERNIAKLKSRYPEKFTEHDANNRDLDAEKDALENS